jgi:catechol 2,3-dioxygenase-like lactoylglutathione lyase family enzyme
MVGQIDHVGYLARDWEVAIEQLAQLFDLPVTHHFERPEFSLVGGYLGTPPVSVEVFSFRDENLLNHRLTSASLRLDHVAFLVDDINAAASDMRSKGVRFAGPDLRQEIHAPIELDGIRHLWTLPPSAQEQSIQLVER